MPEGTNRTSQSENARGRIRRTVGVTNNHEDLANISGGKHNLHVREIISDDAVKHTHNIYTLRLRCKVTGAPFWGFSPQKPFLPSTGYWSSHPTPLAQTDSISWYVSCPRSSLSATILTTVVVSAARPQVPSSPKVLP